MRFLRTYIKVVDTFNAVIGRIITYGIFVMMGILLWSIITKNQFIDSLFEAIDGPSLWTLEAAQFSMITYFFLGGAYAVQMGSHVRMDLFYDNWSPKRKAFTDLVMVFCLLTYLVVLLWGGLGSTAYSLGYFGSEPIGFFVGLVNGSEEVGTMERSRTLWRPYLWPIKTVLCIGIVLMLLQALSELFKDFLRIRGEVL